MNLTQKNGNVNMFNKWNLTQKNANAFFLYTMKWKHKTTLFFLQSTITQHAIQLFVLKKR